MRRLSNYEWLAFQDEINVPELYFPPEGGIVDWNGMKVLVFENRESGEVFLTDVSDRPDIAERFDREYNVLANAWWYHVPRETMARTLEVVASLPEIPRQTGEIMVHIAKTIGETAGAATGPLLGNLTLPLIVLGGVALLVAMKR